MNKTALAIQMLEYLSGGGRKSRKEIAQHLEITERKVIELKLELETAGYIIHSTTGKYGGYELESKNILPVLQLSEKEKEALNYSSQYLNNKKDFLYLNDFQIVLEKMKVISNTQYIDTQIIYKSNQLNESLQQEIKKLQEAIHHQYKIKLNYIALNSTKINEYEIEPYWIVFIDDAYYLIGYEINKKSFRVFKLVAQRLKKVIYTNEYFYKENYQLKNVIGSTQLIKNNLVEVLLHVFGMSARILYEKEIGIMDEKKWITPTTLEVKTTVEGIDKIQSLVLSLGKDCVVIKPDSLKDEVISQLQFALKNYK